jgi:large subunit ribosomal protein L49
VYIDFKRGGNLKITMVRRVDGNLQQLADELKTILDKKEDEVVVNRPARRVSVKGHHRKEIIAFLTKRGITPVHRKPLKA